MRFEFLRLTPWLLGLLLITGLGCRDGGPHMIDILGIFPTGVIGEEGDEVTFSALTDSSTPTSLTYAWDFDDATNPATSTEATPTVQLTVAGSYSGTLTVSDGSDTGTAPFSFEIEPGVIIVTGITPTEPAGLPAGTVSFEAITEGTATSAEWTFDGGTDIETSSDLSPLLHLGEVGTYSGSVTLSNENHTADPFPFEFRIDPPVAPNWRITTLGPASLEQGSGSVQPWTCAFVWNNRPGAFFNRVDGVYLALATIEDPLDEGDWNITQIAENHIVAGTRVVAVLENTLHVLHFGPQDPPNPFRGTGLHISSTSTANPAGPEDWVTGEVDALAGFQWPSLIGIEGSGLVVAYANDDRQASVFDPFRPIIGTTSSFSPEGTEDWELADLELFEGLAQNMEHLYVSGGELYLLFDGYTSTGPRRMIAHSAELFPESITDWEAVLAIGLAAETTSSQILTPAGLAILGQRLCKVDSIVAGGGLTFHNFLSSDGLAPDLSTPWVPGGAIGESLSQEALGYTISTASGRGVGVVRDGVSQQPILWRQLTADPSAFTAGSWMATSIATAGGSLASMAIFPDQRMLAIWIEPNSLTLVAAISDGPY